MLQKCDKMPFRRCAEVALLEDYFPTNLRWFRVLFTTVQYVFYASLLTYSRDKYKQYSYGSSNGPISITTSSHVSISSFASPGSSCVYVILLHILMDYTLVFVHAHKQMQVYRTTHKDTECARHSSKVAESNPHASLECVETAIGEHASCDGRAPAP